MTATVNLSTLTRRRLVSVTVAQYIYRDDAPEVTDVWLHLEHLTIGVDVGADWSFRITPAEPGQGYTMDDLGARVEIVPAPGTVPFARYVGELLVGVEAWFDPDDPSDGVGAEFAFESGSVLAKSFGGELHLDLG
ncbi:hypothetical protein [Sphaerisporangium corydalis]|uniref:Uncharacterized protein n=1 Tax=Sphaerisporangium corydalis TaxID=1441875 RepID=A0ABV9ERM7_9ACTN|nr:hypothetical protein [Sphaerisporangium corydalis]